MKKRIALVELHHRVLHVRFHRVVSELLYEVTSEGNME